MAGAVNTIRSDARPVTMVLRGARLRCPRCGGGKLFRNWFKLKQRCPTCGYKFEREAGFWLGGYVMNVVIGEGLLAIYLLVFAAKAISNPDIEFVPWLTGAIVLAVVPPLLFFPFSRTTWMAMDLLLHPLEPWEVAEADVYKISSESRNNS
ncbi:MAG TPA: DUF983 domain-containing protein [Acidimicrobiales bacterium]|nr:DUF983 domain-containing protein [Acidimicrobiales bacterium]